MFGLFFNTYDYYEWHDLMCVSASEGDLIAYWKELDDGHPLVQTDEEFKALEFEQRHYVIEEVELV